MAGMCRLTLIAILSCAAAASTRVIAQDVPPATAIVRGRVVAATNGAPVRGAEVRLRRVDGRDSRLITTNQQGQYEFNDLAAGDWTLKASKAGFVTHQYGQEHPLSTPPPLVIGTGQKVTADIRLSRGGAIPGRVLDQYGEPVVGARIQVMRARIERGQRRLVASGTVDETDDTGAFRVYGLLPGDYYVAATFFDGASSRVQVRDTAATYYPGTTRIREAQRVRVEAGSETPAITIAATPPEPGTFVSGLVLEASGAPAAGAMVHLYDADKLAAVATRGSFVQADVQGRFTVNDVVPGSYLIEATSRMQAGPAVMERTLATIEVPSGGLFDVTLATATGSTLNLTIAAAPGSVLPEIFTIGISARMGGTNEMSINRATLRKAEARIVQMPGIFGRAVVSITDLPQGWTLEALEIEGRDVAETEVDFSALGATVAARAVVTDRPAEVSGVVTFRGQPRAATVVIFAEDSSRWTYPSRFVRTTRADEDGRFRISDLPPFDRYRALAISSLDEDEIQDPETLAAMKGAGVAFRLLRGERKALDVTAIVR